MKRRDFLHDISHALATPFMLSGLDLSSILINSDSFSNTLSPGRILILIKLNGGNDGLNTLVPFDQYPGLNYIRPDVILPEDKVLNLNENDLGLHPSMGFFKELYTQKRLKIVQSVAYPAPSYSHFRSMDIWQSASDSNIFESSGWLGRYLENLHPNYPLQYPNENYPDPLAVELNNSSMSFTGKNVFTSVVTTSYNPGNYTEIFNPFNYEYPNTKTGEKLAFLQLIGKQANTYNKRLTEVYSKKEDNVDFPNNHFGSQLRVVSRLINSGLNTRIYSVELGGFDTHDFQVDGNDHTKGVHAVLLKELNDGIESLMKSLDLAKNSDRVMGLIFSEFGRTVNSNKTQGTDHGTAAPMFIFGNKVDPNISGVNPIVPTNADLQYELDMQYDFRQVYYSVIKQWLGGSKSTAKDVLFKDFDEIQIVGKEFVDSDNDGVADIYDDCPDTPAGAIVGLDGCELFSLPQDNYTLEVVSASCIGSENGQIKLSAANTDFVYQVEVSGMGESFELASANGHELLISDLGVGSHTLDIRIEDKPSYLQTFEVSITEPAPLQAQAQVNYTAKKASLRLDGSSVYFVNVNGKQMVASENGYQVALQAGNNIIKVSTPLECQGVYEESIFISEKVTYYPNPVKTDLQIVVPGKDSESRVKIFDTQGNKFEDHTSRIAFNREITLPMGHLKSGIYIVKISGQTVEQTFKIVKQ